MKYLHFSTTNNWLSLLYINVAAAYKLWNIIFLHIIMARYCMPWRCVQYMRVTRSVLDPKKTSQSFKVLDNLQHGLLNASGKNSLRISRIVVMFWR
jgi:hypothetical protein